MGPEKTRCAHPETMAAAAPGSWPRGATLRFFQDIAFPNIDPKRVAVNYVRAVSAWEAVADISFQTVDSVETANIVAGSGPLPDPSYVALSELPPTANFTGTLHQTFSPAYEQLLSDDNRMIECMVHELGHILGLGHSPNPADVMYFELDGEAFAPAAGDVAAVQALYGPPPPIGIGQYSAVVTAQAAGYVTLGFDGVKLGRAGTYRLDLTVTPLDQK